MVKKIKINGFSYLLGMHRTFFSKLTVSNRLQIVHLYIIIWLFLCNVRIQILTFNSISSNSQQTAPVALERKMTPSPCKSLLINKGQPDMKTAELCWTWSLRVEKESKLPTWKKHYFSNPQWQACQKQSQSPIRWRHQIKQKYQPFRQRL